MKSSTVKPQAQFDQGCSIRLFNLQVIGNKACPGTHLWNMPCDNFSLITSCEGTCTEPILKTRPQVECRLPDKVPKQWVIKILNCLHREICNANQHKKHNHNQIRDATDKTHFCTLHFLNKLFENLKKNAPFPFWTKLKDYFR